jgi:hypothetical protein
MQELNEKLSIKENEEKKMQQKLNDIHQAHTKEFLDKVADERQRIRNELEVCLYLFNHTYLC